MFGAKFYLYRIFFGDMTLYIGKGSGKRLADQKRAFGVDGEIIAEFEDEAQCYREEKRLIKRHSPPLNRHPGGCGGWAAIGPAELPNGLTKSGLPLAAPHLARIIAIWNRDKSLVGLLSVVGSYVSAHGFDTVSEAVGPHLRRLLVNNLTIENNI